MVAQQRDWTWVSREGEVRSRADLDEIHRQHRLWLTPERKRGLDGWWESDLKGANLHGADLSYFMLVQANLDGSNLSNANLAPVALTSATLKGADISNSDLTGSILTDAFFGDADLRGVVFEPRGLTRPDYIAAARHLELMTYKANPGALNQLRKQFLDAEYRQQ
jgi:uncharacterized protein YjbI with pentapeptide repeats